jgi:hypothetical protein
VDESHSPRLLPKKCLTPGDGQINKVVIAERVFIEGAKAAESELDTAFCPGIRYKDCCRRLARTGPAA